MSQSLKGCTIVETVIFKPHEKIHEEWKTAKNDFCGLRLDNDQYLVAVTNYKMDYYGVVMWFDPGREGNTYPIKGDAENDARIVGTEIQEELYDEWTYSGESTERYVLSNGCVQN